MANYRITAKAKRDLLHIGRYTDKLWGRLQRNNYLAGLDASFNYVSANPLAGTVCNEILSGYRKYLYQSHFIFYQLNQTNSVDIIRILHKRMDVQLHV